MRPLSLRLLRPLAMLVALVAGCGGEPSLPGAGDAGTDAASIDAGRDAAMLDATSTEDGGRGSGERDAAMLDAGAADVGIDADPCDLVCDPGDDVVSPSDCVICAPGATTACYDGPPATDGVGICHAGLRTCSGDGAGYGPCAGQVVPAVEDCATPIDEDCDGVVAACPPLPGATLSADLFGGAASETARAVDAAGGRIVVGGSIASTTDFGTGALTPAGGDDAFVAMFEADGTAVWAHAYGDAAAQSARAVVLLPGGDVVVAGVFQGAINLGGGALTSSGMTDIFVARLDASGAHVWSRRYGGTGADVVAAVATDGTRVVLTGSFEGSVDFGGGPLVSAGLSDVFLTSLDLGGGFVWSRRFGNAQTQQGMDVAVSASGEVALAGNLLGSADFGAGTLTSAGGSDVFLASFDASGVGLWSRRFGDAALQNAMSVVVTSEGNLVIGGGLNGTADFGGGPLAATGGIADAFVAAFTPTGTHLWSHRYGDASLQVLTSLAASAAGGVVLTASLTGTIDLGGGAITSAGDVDVLVGALDASGGFLWAHGYGDANAQFTFGVAVDTLEIVAVGSIAGTTDFGTGSLVSAGADDAFMLLLAP